MRTGTRDQKTARRPRTGFCFQPPEVEVDAEKDWLVLRAFGPPDAGPFVAPQELNRERILDLGCGDGVLTEKIAFTEKLV